MSLPELRKLVTYDEDTVSDGGRACTPPLRMIAVAAVVTNPWYGRGFVEPGGSLHHGVAGAQLRHLARPGDVVGGHQRGYLFAAVAIDHDQALRR